MFDVNIIVIISAVISVNFGVLTENLNPNCSPSGICVSISSCQPDKDRHPYIKAKFQCGGNETDTLVCCDDYLANIDLPDKDNCGDVSMSTKIFGGNDTALDEFPWMALLEYERTKQACDSQSKKCIACAGSLINQRYVLTAAHCIVGRIIRDMGELTHVRLGEYHIFNSTDCINDECSDPILMVGVEATFLYPNNSEIDSSVKYNDIGLVRLSENVKYTDYIRPICLPSTVNMVPSNVGTLLQVAGWGRTTRSPYNEKKQKIFLPVYDQASCSSKFEKIQPSLALRESQLCAGGNLLQDACIGDSGGPLMKLNYTVYALEGIVSYGYGCGRPGWPGVYIRVSSFESWIKNNILP